MARKILFWSFSLIAVGVIAYTFIVLYKGKQEWQNVYSVIPLDAAAVVEFHAPQTNLAAASICNRWNDLAEQYLGELNAHFPRQDGQHSIVFAAFQANADSGWIGALGLPAFESNEEVQMITKALGFGSGKQLIGWNIMDSKDGLFAVVFRNCLVISPKINSLEFVLRKNSDEDFLRSDQVFQKVLKTASADEDVHFFFSDSKHNWLGLDYPSKSPESVWYGYEVLRDSSLSPMRVLSSGSVFLDPSAFGARCLSVDQFSSGDPTADWQARKELFSGSAYSAMWNMVWQSATDSCSCNLEDAFLSWQKGIRGTALFETDSSETVTVGFIAIDDSVDLRDWIAPLLLQSADGVSEILYPGIFQVNQMPEHIAEPKYVAWNEHLLFYSSSAKLVKELSNKSPTWLDANGCGRWSWSNTQMTSGFSNSIAQYIHPTLPFSMLFRPASDGKILVEGRLRGQNLVDNLTEQEPIDTSSQNEVEIAPVKGRTWQVKNHLTGDTETFIQDAENYVSLQGSDAKVLWRTQAGEGIVGEVVQIDAFKNGKLQYLFCTNHFVNLLDRKGKQVAGFPVKFKDEIKSGPIVIDYDQKKNYRILIIRTEGVANLIANGQFAAGWKYEGPSNICSAAGIRHQGQDYIVVSSCAGDLSLLKRNGEKIETKWSKLESYSGGKISVVGKAGANTLVLTWPSTTGVEITQELIIPR